MAGKLIALESTNQQLLDKTAKYLALKLQSEGHNVEVINFPRQKQNSSYYVETHQKGEYGSINPYAASMFYILDRYDATHQITQLVASNTIVICKGFKGTSLATLGAAIHDSGARKGFYIWADSLESGTFGVPRPDMAIVLSEELPTLYELCELFPKDYVFAIDPTKVRTMLNRLIPPAPAIHKHTHSDQSWISVLQAAGSGEVFDFTPGLTYVRLSKKSKSQKLYATGLRELEVLRAKVAASVPSELAEAALQYVTPIGLMGDAADGSPGKQYKNRVFVALLAENFEPNFGSLPQAAVVLGRSHHSELDALQELVLPKTELSADDVGRAVNFMAIGEKIKLFKAYLDGADNQPQAYPLDAVQVNVAVKISYYELAALKIAHPRLRYTLQAPTPRWGYDIPDEFEAAIDAIEDCFMSSLKLHSALEAAGEHNAAANCVLKGNFVQAIVHLSGSDIRGLGINEIGFKDSAVAKLRTLLQEKFPLLTMKS